MNKKAAKNISSMDAAVVKVVEELRAYAKIHPEAGTVKSVLDAILDSLIHEILGVEPVEGEEKLSVLLLEELAALFPDSTTPLLYLSKICLDKGDRNEALAYAEAGLRVDPDYPDLVYNRSLALLETGKHKAGIEGFRRYIELNPDNPLLRDGCRGARWTRCGKAPRHLRPRDGDVLRPRCPCDGADRP